MSMGDGGTAGSSLDHRYILFTDIYQSSRLCEKYPKVYASTLDIHDAASEKAIQDCGGQVHRNTGDGYIALFDTSTNCLACAVRMQQEFSAFPPLSDEDPLLVRIVAHGCIPPAYRSDYFDAALSRASRICQVCYPGQVLASQAVVFHAEGMLPDATELLDLGIHYLRDLAEPEHLYQLDHEKFARREFPPLPTLGNRPNNLLLQPNAFIGRERELAELKDLLLGGRRLVTIAASGGYGKSRLAAHLCADLLECFERGVFFVELAPVRDHTGIPTALANATGFQFYGNRDPKEQLVDYLREKEMLLCFDNFEHVLEGVSFVGNILKEAPKVKVIVTSREPLRITGEQVYALDPLPVQKPAADGNGQSAAALLFADRATLVDSAFVLDEENLADVQAICQQLDGVPLAIELAAAWMDNFTLSELLTELDRQLELTARLSDVPNRHRSLRASLDWSWRMLGEEQQRMLMQLSTFRGGCFAEAASAVLGAKGMPLRQGLSQLADKSWLFSREMGGRSRYLIRDAASHEYAFEKLAETRVDNAISLFEQAVVDHARYFSELMGSEGERLHGHGQLEALHVIGQEIQNIYEALDTLLNRLKGANTAENATELALPIVRWLWWHLALTAAYQELLDLYQVLKNAFCQIQGQHRLLLWAFIGCSLAQLMLGDFDAAHSHARHAVAEAEILGDRCGIAASHRSLGKAEQAKGNIDVARELFTGSLTIDRKISNRYGIAHSLIMLAQSELVQGSYAAGREMCAEALAINREIGNYYGIAHSLNMLGQMELAQSNYVAAREMCTEALAINREIGDRAGIAMSLAELGAIESIQENFSTARGLYTEALVISREIGARIMIAAYLRGLAAVESALGNNDEAREMCTESLAIDREIRNRIGMAAALDSLGSLELKRDNYRAARKMYAEALAITCEISSHYGICAISPGVGYLLACCAQEQAGAICLHGAHHHSARLGFTLEPTASELMAQGLAIIESAETGLPPAECERLKAQAKSMSVDELAEFALDALKKLEMEQKQPEWER